MNINKKRIEWVDIAKYICIIWVILSHLETKTDILRMFYSPFFLYGFLFASGYVYRPNRDFKTFFIKKVKGLFIPWLIFSVFIILSAHLMSFNEHASLWDELKWNFLQIRDQKDQMWFVAALFTAFIPFYFLIGKYEAMKQKQRKKAVLFLLLVSFSLSVLYYVYDIYMDPTLLPWGSVKLPWHIEYILIADFWMALGYLFKDVFEPYYEKIGTAPVGAVGMIVYLLLVYLPMLLARQPSPTVSLHVYRIVYITYQYLCSFVGIFCLVFVSKTVKPNKYMLYIGENTLICFALHGKVFSLLQHLLARFAGTLYAAVLCNTLTSSLFAVVLSLIVSVILIVPIYMINRWAPFLVGRSYPKK